MEKPRTKSISSLHDLFKYLIIVTLIASLIFLLFFSLFIYSAAMLRYEMNGKITWNETHYEAQVNLTNNGLFPVYHSIIVVIVENTTNEQILNGGLHVSQTIGVGQQISFSIALLNISPVIPGIYNISIYSILKMAYIERISFNYFGEVSIS
ncbi:MAG: hypothetical protein ACTSRS_04780 [Candidatus Helarchaeota archaeon]